MAVRRYFTPILRDRTGFRAVFPDFPGAGAGGDTIDDALSRAEDNLAAHVAARIGEGLDTPEPRTLEEIRAGVDLAEDLHKALAIALVPVASPEKAARVNITRDSALLGRIDAMAARRGESRSGFIAEAARERLRKVG